MYFFQLGGHNLSSIGLPPLLSWMTLNKLLKISVFISSSKLTLIFKKIKKPYLTQDYSEEQRRAKMTHRKHSSTYCPIYHHTRIVSYLTSSLHFSPHLAELLPCPFPSSISYFGHSFWFQINIALWCCLKFYCREI